MIAEFLKDLLGGGWGMSDAVARRAIALGRAPSYVVVEKDLDLRGGCLAKLPEKLIVKGSLDIRDCAFLAALPEKLCVSGELLASNCRSLVEIPSRLFVTWSMDFSGCRALKRVCDGLVAQWNLRLDNCVNLESLPAELFVGGSLYLQNCPALKSLPRNLKVSGTLSVINCPELQNMPDELRAGCVEIRNCPKLRALGSTVFIERDAWISGCPDITLPDGLKVGGSLSLEGSTMVSLPYQITVGGSLELNECRNLTNLGSWLEVGRRASFENCARLERLDGLMSAEQIDVGGTRITSLPKHLEEAQMLWRGVFVPTSFVTEPEKMTVEEILGHPNAEVRRVMLERFGVERFVNSAGAVTIHADNDPGGERRLLRIDFSDDEPLVCLQVQCPSTGALYILRVPPNMRSCPQAAAWIAGYDDPEEWNPIVET